MCIYVVEFYQQALFGMNCLLLDANIAKTYDRTGTSLGFVVAIKPSLAVLLVSPWHLSGGMQLCPVTSPRWLSSSTSRMTLCWQRSIAFDIGIQFDVYGSFFFFLYFFIITCHETWIEC